MQGYWRRHPLGNKYNRNGQNGIKQRGKYPNSVTWWKNYVKKKIRYLFMAEEKERAWDDKMMERHPARTDPTKREVCQVTPVEGQNHQAT